MQKSFDLEDHIKNHIDNLDDKDEKLHQFLAEPNNPNQKRLSALDVKNYQENQMQLEMKQRESSYVIPDLISNFTDNNREFFSDDSRVQNSLAESIDYKYFDHMNEDSNNIMKLNKEKEFPVRNSSTLAEKQRNNKLIPNNSNSNEKLKNKDNKEQEQGLDGNVNRNYSNLNLNQKDYTAERNLESYSFNKKSSVVAAAEKNNNYIEDYKSDKKLNNNDQEEEDEDVDYGDEYEEEEEEYEDEDENEYRNKINNQRHEAANNNKAKIGLDGNIVINNKQRR